MTRVWLEDVGAVSTLWQHNCYRSTLNNCSFNEEKIVSAFKLTEKLCAEARPWTQPVLMEIITGSECLGEPTQVSLIMDRHRLSPRGYQDGTQSKLNPSAHLPF